MTVLLPQGIKGLSKVFIKDNLVFSNGPRSLPRNPLDCTILGSSVFDNFILADLLLMKAFRTFETFLSIGNNLCGKMFDDNLIFDGNLKLTTVILIRCELNNLTCKLLYLVILHWYYIKER